MPGIIISFTAASSAWPGLTLTGAQAGLLIASAVLLVLAAGVRLFIIPRFAEAPRGWQNGYEGVVEGVAWLNRRLAALAVGFIHGAVKLARRLVRLIKELVMKRKNKPLSKTTWILIGATAVLAVLEIIISRSEVSEPFTFSLVPPELTLAWLGGLQISVTQLNALVATLVLILLAALARIFVIPRFTDVPHGIQNVLEIMVEGIGNYTKGLTGSWAANSLSPYIFTLGAYIVCSGLLEYFGLRSNLTDYNSTVALAAVTFILIQVYGITKKGLWGRLKVIGKPVAAIAPIKIITDLAVPVSLASRIFGNLMGGYIVIELIYSILAAKFALPAILSIYFTLFDTVMQAFIFITLSLTFIGEVIE